MVIYEVNIKILKDVTSDYLVWLKEHINEILLIEGFIKAEIYEVESTVNSEFYDSNYSQICVHYYLLNHEFLDSYFTNHAPKLRQDGIDKFGDKFSASRRILIQNLNL